MKLSPQQLAQVDAAQGILVELGVPSATVNQVMPLMKCCLDEPRYQAAAKQNMGIKLVSSIDNRSEFVRTFAATIAADFRGVDKKIGCWLKQAQDGVLLSLDNWGFKLGHMIVIASAGRATFSLKAKEALIQANG